MTDAEIIVERSSSRRLWWRTGAAATLWFVAYVVNGPLWDRLLFDVAELDAESHLGESVHFFAMDIIKISLLLGGIIFVVAVLRTFITVERTRDLLGGRRQIIGYTLAAALGVATPFCSCSAVPVFIGFVAAGVPLGITMTFLIASPLVNEVAVVLVAGSFGWATAALYVTTGLTIAVVAGVVIGRLGLERWVEPFVYETSVGAASYGEGSPGWPTRLTVARAEVRSIFSKIWPYLIIGIGIGAVIHGWAPDDWFAEYAGDDDFFAVPIAVILGVPLYSNAAGTIPLVEALHAKGVALGTSLAFMMSVVALSLPEMVLLRRVLRPRLLATFVVVVASGILITGLLFNQLL
jgi:uncharacterized membrane protein YraQ (UPF0718 family)